MKIIVDEKIPYLKGILEPFAKIEYYPGTKITNKIVEHADALIIRTRTKCDENLLNGSDVKFIATATIGFDHIDTQFCKNNAIKWTNAPGCNSGSVMQYIASALVQLSNKYNFTFSEKTIGIIGVGNVGSKVAQLASILGLKVLLNDPPRERKEGKGEFVSLEEIQKNADIISFHVPLIENGIDKTFHLFDNTFMNSLKENVILLNSSRGEVVSTLSLKKALKSKKVKSAVIDVWENEPQIDLELLSLVDIATPHIAGYSDDGKANGTLMSIQALSKFFKLGLNNWFPKQIPEPSNKYFTIECEEKSTVGIIKEAILTTYDIKRDDKILRALPDSFEKFRGEYALRREFSAYKPTLINDTKNTREILNMLGFM